MNDLYVRFFRVAERRITEKTRQGVICFISNYSWLDGISFSGMREHLLNTFGAVRIDNLHGDRIISEYAPDGKTSETVFALPGQSPGIKVGTSIALFTKSGNSLEDSKASRVLYRDFSQARADERRKALLENVESAEIDDGYFGLQPDFRLGLPFKPMAMSKDWFDWPALPDLMPHSFPGVHTGRDSLLVGIDEDRLKKQVSDYFNPAISHEEIGRLCPAAMRNSSAFKISDSRATRDALLLRGGPNDSGFIQISYRPFDIRWLYWEPDRRLLTAPAPDYKPHVFKGNLWLSSAKHLRKGASEPQAFFTTHVGSFHLRNL